MKASVVLCLVVLLLLCAGATGFATDWFVATNGNDSNAGTIDAPLATLNHAVIYHAQPGDTVYVRAGTYGSGGILTNINGPGPDGYCAEVNPNKLVLGGAPGAPITICPYDGDFSVSYIGGFRVVRCKYLTITGFDMSLPAGGHPFSVVSGCSDWATPDKRSNHIILRNCKVHDGGSSSGQLKLQQSDYLTVEDCEMYNLGAGGAVIDCVWVEHTMSRRNYIHGGYGSAGFYKGGSTYSTFEGNVATDPLGGQITWGFMPGGQTGVEFANPDPDVPYESIYTVIRNNIVIGQTRGALPTEECGYCYAYNNLFKDCGEGYSTYSYVTVISTGAPRFDNYTRHDYVFNNIFFDSDGDMRPYGWQMAGSGYYEDFQTGYNNFWNQGNPLLYETTFINPNTETGAKFGNPNLTNPTGTATTWQGWVNLFRPTVTSTLIVDQGTSAAGSVPYPGVVRDIEGNARPQGSGWDIGPCEYASTTVIPVANFVGDPVSGVPPLYVSFTDYSSGGPTSWSWTFGDSGTSTAQNPSHTYAAGTYTVSLTATNASGSDGETKTNYITAAVASPAFVAAGNVAYGTGAITPALPAGVQTNDILLLFLETANQAISISNQNGGTWTQVTNSPQGYGTAAATNATRLTVFWSRYNGTQGAPTTSDSGNHQIGRIIAIRGAATSGDPCNVTAGGTESTVDTSGAIPGATTTVGSTLVVAAIATSLPDANGTANFSAWTNADLTSVTERTDNTRNVGNGGGLGIATGAKATAGAYTTTSVTCGTATTKAMMSIAIKP